MTLRLHESGIGLAQALTDALGNEIDDVEEGILA